MSAKTRLTDISVQRLAEGTYWDASTPAFGIRIGKRFRTFICVRDGGNRISIGRYPQISLQDARKEAKALLLGVMEKKTGTGFQEAVARYLRQMEGELRPRTHYEYGLILKRESFTTTNVSAAEITASLEKIEKVSARSHAYTVLRIFCNWCVQQGHMSSSPMMKVRKPKVQAPRERVLTDQGQVRRNDPALDVDGPA